MIYKIFIIVLSYPKCVQNFLLKIDFKTYTQTQGIIETLDIAIVLENCCGKACTT